MPDSHEEAQVLLTKARHDLQAARALLADSDLRDVVCFHAQQAVEKSLKAVLLLQGIKYPFRHDLDELMELLAPFPHR